MSPFQPCTGLQLVGEPGFKGGLCFTIGKTNPTLLLLHTGLLSRKGGKERSKSRVKHPSLKKISTSWYVLITWELHGTCAQPEAGSSLCSCHLIWVLFYFLLARSPWLLSCVPEHISPTARILTMCPETTKRNLYCPLLPNSAVTAFNRTQFCMCLNIINCTLCAALLFSITIIWHC